MYTGKILLSLILLITTKDLVIGQDFYLHENGVTIVCDNAEVGQNWNLDGWWYVKRSIDQITPENARTSCVSGIENMSELFRNEENLGHYIRTPYSYKPLVGRKYTPKTHIDLGQGMLDLVYELKNLTK